MNWQNITLQSPSLLKCHILSDEGVEEGEEVLSLRRLLNISPQHVSPHVQTSRRCIMLFTHVSSLLVNPDLNTEAWDSLRLQPRQLGCQGMSCTSLNDECFALSWFSHMTPKSIVSWVLQNDPHELKKTGLDFQTALSCSFAKIHVSPSGKC